MRVSEGIFVVVRVYLLEGIFVGIFAVGIYPVLYWRVYMRKYGGYIGGYMMENTRLRVYPGYFHEPNIYSLMENTRARVYSGYSMRQIYPILCRVYLLFSGYIPDQGILRGY